MAYMEGLGIKSGSLRQLAVNCAILKQAHTYHRNGCQEQSHSLQSMANWARVALTKTCRFDQEVTAVQELVLT